MIGPDAGCIIASQSQPFKVKGKGRLDFIWASGWSNPNQKPSSLVDTGVRTLLGSNVMIVVFSNGINIKTHWI